MFKDITQQKHDQAKMLEQEKSLSILSERERLGRELHDAQGQFPGYVKIQTEAIKLLVKKGRIPEAMEQLTSLSKAADTSFQDVRESITGLNITARDWEFFEKFQTWLLQFENMSGITIQYSGPKVRPPNWILPEAEVQLFRMIQETLVNTRKHSGASSAKVVFSFTADCLVVVIEDDGCGFEMEKMQDKLVSFGLNIIKERAADIDGHCEVQSVPNQGTTVRIKIPLLKTK